MAPRVVVVGTGGVGGVIAARLTRAGVDVTPVTGNAEIAAALARDGYRVREIDRREWTARPARAPVVAAADAAAQGPFDLCVAATKMTTLASALVDVAPALRDGAPVVLCQNGLPEELAAGVVGARRVLGCVVVFGATMSSPGVYELTSRTSGLQLGRHAAASPDPGPVAELLDAVAPTTVVDDLAAVRWSKLALNCATSTLGAIGGVRLGALLRRRFVRRLVLELWTEIAAVARAAGVKMAPVGGTLDVERMALTAAERAAALGSPRLAVKHSILVAVGMKYRRMRSSMLVALERGRTPEIDYLNGEIVRRGAALGIPTPVNSLLTAAVHRLAAGHGTPSLPLLRTLYDQARLPRESTRLAA